MKKIFFLLAISLAALVFSFSTVSPEIVNASDVNNVSDTTEPKDKARIKEISPWLSSITNERFDLFDNFSGIKITSRKP